MRDEDGSHLRGEVGGEDRLRYEDEVSVKERRHIGDAEPGVFSTGHSLIGTAGDSPAASEAGEPLPGGVAGGSLADDAHKNPNDSSDESPCTTVSAGPLLHDTLRNPQIVADEHPFTSSRPESPHVNSAAEVPHPTLTAGPLTTPPLSASIPRDPENFGDTGLVDLLRRLSAGGDRFIDLCEIPGRRTRMGDWFA